MNGSDLVVSDAASVFLGNKGATIVTLIILISLIGANNGSILTSARINYAMARDKLFFHISANRFLQHMVRFLVGTMVEVGRGRYSIDDFTQFMNGGHPTLSVVRAPAHGLFLKKVSYEN